MGRWITHRQGINPAFLSSCVILLNLTLMALALEPERLVFQGRGFSVIMPDEHTKSYPLTFQL